MRSLLLENLLWINRHGIKKPLSPIAKLENMLLQSFLRKNLQQATQNLELIYIKKEIK